MDNKRMLESLLLRTKIAVAVAIIKSKPDTLSSREYAEQLWSIHQKSYRSLTTKCQLLSLELMSANHHQLNTLDGNGSTPDEPLFPTPPSSDKESTKPCPELRDKSLQHHAFHVNMLKLKAATRHRDSFHDLNAVTISSVVESIGVIQNMIGLSDCNKLLASRCVQCIVDVCSSDSGGIYSHVHTAVEDLIKNLVNKILTCEDLNQWHQQQHYSDLLEVLSHCRHLNAFVIKTLLHKVEQFASHLRKVNENKQALDPAWFENVWYVLLSLEISVKLHLKSTDCGENSNLLADVRARLDECLLHISEAFPLFSLFVWRIQSHVEPS